MACIYCVEDDEGIRELISCALKSGGYEVKAFEKAVPFYEALKTRQPALILLDIMLPDEDGISILTNIKKNEVYSDIPVIMLTAKSSEIDKVTGLEAGADDYITKPFGVMELLSRIKAVLRRTKKDETTSNIMSVGRLTLNFQKRLVKYDEKNVVLTFKEFELLAYLMQNQGIVLTREKLMEKVWGFDFEGESRTVDMHIKTLRQKLEQAGCVDIIHTVRGVGYKIV